jgi:phenylacetate-CoA ligase
LSRKYNKKQLVKINTSGTTGTPMTIYLTPEARKMNYAFFARSKKWAGIDGFERSVTFAGRLIVPQKQENPPYWRSNFFFRNNLFSSYHISEETIPLYVEAILRIQPRLIDTYPSSLYPIAEFILDKGVTDIRPRAIITSAETLLEHQREIIEKAFDCKIYDQYGSAEQVVFACQCEHGSYHLNPEFGCLEVVDSNNNPVQAGEIGEFVCTGFTNDAMPLIRYKIGDMGILSGDKCPCGRNFPVIEKIVGRMDDILITPEGRYVGRLDPIFKGMSNTIKKTQIVQQAVDLVDVFIVRSDGYHEKDGISVVTELKKRMGGRVTFNVRYVDEIPRTSSGKFRSVVNNIPSS